MKPGLKFLNSLFEVTHLEFQAYDLTNYRVLFSSGMVHRLLGYTEEQYLELSSDFYKNIVHPDDFQKVKDAIDKMTRAKNNEVVEMTLRLRKSDGTYIWAYSRQMIYERNSSNNVTTIIREVEDVTRLVELQNELQEKVEKLQAVSYKNSHELRGPVASIMGLIDLVEEHGVTGEQNRQIFKYLKETITKLDSVIYEINNVAQVR